MEKYQDFFKRGLEDKPLTENLDTSKRRIIDTYHAIDRFLNKHEQRFSNMSKDTFTKVIRDAIKVITTKYKDVSGSYGIHSKSKKIGLIVDWRKDRLNDNGENHAIIVTLLPIKPKHYFDKKDTVIIVEQFLKLVIENGDSILKENHYITTRFDNSELFVVMDGFEVYDHNMNAVIEVE